MWEVFLDALLDTLKIFPFIFVIYVLIELLEQRASFIKDHNRLQGDLAPLIGAATGIIPQCGFSVMAAKLYDKGLIRTGTLLAVFLATSDEALILLLSEGSKAGMVVPVIAVKLVVAVALIDHNRIGLVIGLNVNEAWRQGANELRHGTGLHTHKAFLYDLGWIGANIFRAGIRGHEGNGPLALAGPQPHGFEVGRSCLGWSNIAGFLDSLYAVFCI